MADIRIQNGLIEAVIHTKGAELASLKKAGGEERLWCGDDRVWGYTAPILFPVAGALYEDTLVHEGKKYPMRRHGFARESEFELEDSKRYGASFTLRGKKENYPFDYLFRARYTLKDNTLVIDYETENIGNGALYFSCGAHEAYACPGGVEGMGVRFDETESMDALQLAGPNAGKTRRLPSPDGRTVRLKAGDFECDTLYFPNLVSRGVALLDRDGKKLAHIAFENMPHLLLWTKMGAGYLCIEPWCNAPEPPYFIGEFKDKPGVISLLPGEKSVKTHKITVEK